MSMHGARTSVCLGGHNKSVRDGSWVSYLEGIEASLQVRPVLVFLASGSVELAPPVHELLLLSVTQLQLSARQSKTKVDVLNLMGAPQSTWLPAAGTAEQKASLGWNVFPSPSQRLHWHHRGWRWTSLGFERFQFPTSARRPTCDKHDLKVCSLLVAAERDPTSRHGCEHISAPTLTFDLWMHCKAVTSAPCLALQSTMPRGSEGISWFFHWSHHNMASANPRQHKSNYLSKR